MHSVILCSHKYHHAKFRVIPFTHLQDIRGFQYANTLYLLVTSHVAYFEYTKYTYHIFLLSQLEDLLKRATKTFRTFLLF